MSASATAYVWERSPYDGAMFTIHLAIADVVNDTHGNRFYMSAAKLAKEARCSTKTALRALPEMCHDGFLEVLDEQQHGRAGGRTYRFLTPDNMSTVDKVSTVDIEGANHGHLVPQPWTSEEVAPYIELKQRRAQRTQAIDFAGS